MSFAAFYFFALIPVISGGLLFLFNKRFTWHEWLICSVASFGVAGILHGISVSGMTADEEVWSGQVTRVHYQPEWRERYEVAVYRTETYTTSQTYTSNGKLRTRMVTRTRQVFSHYATRHRTHPDDWTAYTNLDQELSLTGARYAEIVKQFGGEVKASAGRRRTGERASSMVGGDPNDYDAINSTGYVVPVLKGVAFENRVKASPSVFSYARLSEAELAKLPNYPEAKNPWRSDRVIGANIDQYKWDQLAGSLGPKTKANIIIVKMPSAQEARKLEAKWVGGKKNDLVLTYGDGWSYVFGWSEDTRVKRELESLLVLQPVNDDILPEIGRLVREHYKPVDWHKFDYLDLEPSTNHILWYCFTMLVVHGLCIYFGLSNGLDKERA